MVKNQVCIYKRWSLERRKVCAGYDGRWTGPQGKGRGSPRGELRGEPAEGEGPDKPQP